MSDRPHDRILAAAVRLFAREGIRAVGINRVIAEADVAPTTLYRQFGSKDELVTAALEQWSAEWLRWLCDQVDRCGDDVEARLDSLWEALSRWFAAEDFRGSFVGNAALELRHRPEHPAHGAIAGHRAALRRVLEDLVKPWKPADSAATVERLLLLMEGALAIAAVDRRPDAGAEAGRMAMALLG